MLKVKVTSEEFSSLSDALKSEYQLQADGSYKLDLGAMYVTDKDPQGLMSALEKEREENRTVKTKLNELEGERDTAKHEAELAKAAKKGDTEALQRMFAEERQKMQEDFKRQVDEANAQVAEQKKAAAEQRRVNEARKIASEMFGKKSELVLPHILSDLNISEGENGEIQFLNEHGQPDLTMNLEKYKEKLSQNEMFSDMIVQTQASGGSANDRNSFPAKTHSDGKPKAFNDYTSGELVDLLRDDPQEYERLKADMHSSV